jgi:hypothetical protein
VRDNDDSRESVCLQAAVDDVDPGSLSFALLPVSAPGVMMLGTAFASTDGSFFDLAKISVATSGFFVGKRVSCSS